MSFWRREKPARCPVQFGDLAHCLKCATTLNEWWRDVEFWRKHGYPGGISCDTDLPMVCTECGEVSPWRMSYQYVADAQLAWHEQRWERERFAKLYPMLSGKAWLA